MNYYIFRKTPWDKSTILWLSIGFGILSFAATYWMSLFGFRWDEHGIAYGAQLIIQGQVPYRDFGYSAPPLTLYVQALGHLLFPQKYFFSYGFSASLINGLFIGGLSFFLLRALALQILPTLAILIITHFIFFGAAGCIWYNQLAALTFFIAFLLFAYRTFFDGGAFKSRDVFLIAILAGLTFLSKQDIGGISLLLFPLMFLFFAKRKKISSALITFLVSLAVILGGILIFIPFGGDPWHWIYLGQKGFDPRTAGIFSLAFILPFLHITVDNAKYAPLFILLTLEIVILIKTAKGRWNKKDPFLPFAPEIFYVGLLFITTIVLMTSGHGGGYILPHLTTLMMIIVIMQGIHYTGSLKRLFTIFVSLSLITALFLTARRMERDILRKYKHFPRVTVAHLEGYRVPDRMKVFLEKYSSQVDQLSSSLGRPVRAYIEGIYPFMNPKVDSRPYKGPLWPHGGTMAPWEEIANLVNRLKADPPDLFIYFPDMGRYYWGDQKEELENFLKNQFTLWLQGPIEIIGSGGGRSPSRPTLIYLYNKTEVAKGPKSGRPGGSEGRISKLRSAFLKPALDFYR